MADNPVNPNFGADSDTDLSSLISQLSSGPNQSELGQAGLGPLNLGASQAQLSNNHFVSQFRRGGAHGSFVGHALAGKRQKSLDAQREAMEKAYNESYNNFLTERTDRATAAKQELARRHNVNQINGFFNSDSMNGLYDSLRSNVLQDSLLNVMQQYHQQAQQAAFQSADQGLTGSSVDAERRGDVAKGQDQAGVQASQGADQYVQNVKDQNEQQRQALVSTLSQSNPGDAAAISQQEQTIHNQTGALAAGYQSQLSGLNLSQQNSNNQSQALGNLMSTFGGLYRSGQQGAAYGGSGNSF